MQRLMIKSWMPHSAHNGPIFAHFWYLKFFGIVTLTSTQSLRKRTLALSNLGDWNQKSSTEIFFLILHVWICLFWNYLSSSVCMGTHVGPILPWLLRPHMCNIIRPFNWWKRHNFLFYSLEQAWIEWVLLEIFSRVSLNRPS